MHISPLRKVLNELPFGWPDKHIVHEECMIRSSAKGPDLKASILVPANIPVNNDTAHLVVDIVDGELLDDLERFSLEGDVLGTLPVHRFFGLGVLNDSLLALVTYLPQSRIGTQSPTVANICLLSRKIRGSIQEEGNLVELRYSGVEE